MATNADAAAFTDASRPRRPDLSAHIGVSRFGQPARGNTCHDGTRDQQHVWFQGYLPMHPAPVMLEEVPTEDQVPYRANQQVSNTVVTCDWKDVRPGFAGQPEVTRVPANSRGAFQKVVHSVNDSLLVMTRAQVRTLALTERLEEQRSLKSADLGASISEADLDPDAFYQSNINWQHGSFETGSSINTELPTFHDYMSQRFPRGLNGPPSDIVYGHSIDNEIQAYVFDDKLRHNMVSVANAPSVSQLPEVIRARELRVYQS